MFFSAKKLIESLRGHAFTPYYQPIFSNLNNKVSGCEVLARWEHPDKGLLTADSFIESIEFNCLTDALTQELMSSVISQVSGLSGMQKASFLLMLNITLSQVMNPVFRQELIALNNKFKKMSVTPVFEITERENIRNFPGAETIFSSLIQHGMTFAIDDFGAGYSNESLFYITHSRFIKIDRSFTVEPNNPVVRMALILARHTGAQVIAEGVECAGQARWLQDCGVDYLQGYFYGHPMSAENFCGQYAN
ncbi:TPA: EAL domain-containing protein [Salmonella enterica subsp. enterica serovar Birkenhead]|uniref:EAL domain-containing protein n=1 Tax=Salmonella enterica TaxID=28901 RepID=UPI0012A7F3EB|nr:EAL domain-containing protein [Salmonella enterica]EBY7195084.1 EAL domain-containing protein [Salmonella enterica subsp. enterica serovar Birkenhead]EDV0048015.1 EAL domain-containing protein [Salmonella enterica subsp. enterica serovar Birkenhead]EHI3951102.1 EAL domain-containing protein [Salmonella enterica]EHI6135217.1 EAL domain-containing protein [Salmonella enterica]EHI7993482.1 EAL domain-containing protein [Salmonella enterica]